MGLISRVSSRTYRNLLGQKNPLKTWCEKASEWLRPQSRSSVARRRALPTLSSRSDPRTLASARTFSQNETSPDSFDGPNTSNSSDNAPSSSSDSRCPQASTSSARPWTSRPPPSFSSLLPNTLQRPRPRRKLDWWHGPRHEPPESQTPQASDQPPSPAVSTRSLTWSSESRLSWWSSLMTLTRSRLLCTCRLSAERWTSHTALSKARPDSDNLSAESSAPVSLLLTSRTSTSRNSPNSLRP